MRVTKNSLKKYVETFNKLEKNKIDYIFKCLKHDRPIELNDFHKELTDDDIKIFKNLRNYIVNNLDDEQDDVYIKEMKIAGLSGKHSKRLYGHCKILAIQFGDVEIIHSMDENVFKRTVEFVVRNFFLCQDFKNYFPSSIAHKLEINDVVETKKVLRFLYYYISEVSSRSISPNILKCKLMENFDLQQNYVEIFYNSLVENLKELHQAYLVSQIDTINKKIEEIYSILTNIEDGEDDNE